MNRLRLAGKVRNIKDSTTNDFPQEFFSTEGNLFSGGPLAGVTHEPTLKQQPEPRLLVVMSPHSDDLYGLDVLYNLVYEAVLDVDAARIGTIQIADQFFIRRGELERIFGEDIKQLLSLGLKPRSGNFSTILLRMLRKNDLPLHHPGFSLHFSTGVFSPFRIDSRIPGIERRYRVSWIERQSSSEIKMALDLFPVI